MKIVNIIISIVENMIIFFYLFFFILVLNKSLLKFLKII